MEQTIFVIMCKGNLANEPEFAWEAHFDRADAARRELELASKNSTARFRVIKTKLVTKGG